MSEIKALEKVSLYALSTDTREEAQQTVDKHQVRFPVLYGMDGPQSAELLGAYYEERRNIIQPVGFILSPEKKILSVTTASGPVGRLSARDVILLVGNYIKQAAG